MNLLFNKKAYLCQNISVMLSGTLCQHCSVCVCQLAIGESVTGTGSLMLQKMSIETVSAIH